MRREYLPAIKTWLFTVQSSPCRADHIASGVANFSFSISGAGTHISRGTPTLGWGRVGIAPRQDLPVFKPKLGDDSGDFKVVAAFELLLALC